MAYREYCPVIGREDWTENFTFAADGADSDYPATNLATTDIFNIWRGTGLTHVVTATSSKAYPIGLVGLVNHNLSQGARFRLQLYSDTALTTELYDSDDDDELPGLDRVHPICYGDDQLEIEDDNWMTGTYRSSELTDKILVRPIWLRRQYLAKGVKLTLTNPYNQVSDALQMGRLALARGYQFSKGVGLGYAYGHASNAIVSQADGGRSFGEKRLKPMVATGQFDKLPRSEAMEVLGEMKDQHDIVPERGFLWMPFPKDPNKWLRTNGYMRFADLSLQQIALPLHDQVPFNFVQVM